MLTVNNYMIDSISIGRDEIMDIKNREQYLNALNAMIGLGEFEIEFKKNPEKYGNIVLKIKAAKLRLSDQLSEYDNSAGV